MPPCVTRLCRAILERMAMTAAERKAKQRADALARGLCGRCLQVKARRGFRRCAACSEYDVERRNGA